MSRILITGGAGFIGSHFAERCIADGHSVIIIDNLSTGNRSYIPSGAEFIELDLKEEEATVDAIVRSAPDIINHHAAQINVRASIDDPVLDAKENIMGGLNLLKGAVMAGVSRFTFASTGGAIYGSPDIDTLPVPETTPTMPESPYGAAKLAMEHYIRVICHLEKIPFVILRYANVYGPRQVAKGESGVVAVFTQRLIEGKQPAIFGDGTHTRDYVYVGDVVEANVAALTRGDNSAINIATGTRIDVNDVFERIKALTGSDLEPIYGDDIPGEVEHIALDNKLAAEILGWTPGWTIDKGLPETIEYYRNQASAHSDA